MLTQLQKDWKAAITSNERKLVKQDFTRNTKGEQVVKHQTVLFKFRNKEAYMNLELFHGDEALPQASRRYRNTINVPSTNKQVELYPREWSTPIEKMMAILIAFTKGRDHEDRVAVRKQQAKMRENEKMIESYRNKLNASTFTSDEVEFIAQWLDQNTNARKTSWNTVLLDVLVKYHNYITGRGLIEVGINLGSDANMHVNRCYNTVARIITSSTHANGKKFLTRERANPLFLENKDVDLPIYVVRSTFSKIWDRCFDGDYYDSGALFSWVCEFIGAYYAKVTGIPVDKQCADIERRAIEARNRRMARKLNGNPNTQKKFRDHPQGPIMTIDDAYGDVLDEVEKTTKKQHHDKKEYRDRNNEREDEVEATVDQPRQPQLKRKLRPAVVVTDTDELAFDTTPNAETASVNLGSVGDAFDKADLM